MAFLDNSGDIILDAVLTDTGRKRLARGDGSFNVAKFALGDDEINYALYDKEHSSGSAYYDINILQTPVLEAFTNNTSTMKSKLITISRTNLLYLPEIKLHTTELANGYPVNGTYNMHTVVVDEETRNTIRTYATSNTFQYIDGFETSEGLGRVVLDQGLDTAEIAPQIAIDPDLRETQYIIHIDHRLGMIADANGQIANYSFLDDDNVATYYFSENTSGGPNSGYVQSIGLASSGDVGTDTSALAGPRGTRIEFRIKASDNLQNGTFLFDQIGLAEHPSYTPGSLQINSVNYRAIDSIIKIMGATTGYSVEIPIRYIKKV